VPVALKASLQVAIRNIGQLTDFEPFSAVILRHGEGPPTGPPGSRCRRGPCAAGWAESCRTFLASRGATWDPGADHGEGTITVPAGRDDEWAEQLWEEAAGRFDVWIEGVVRETREGRHLAPPGDIRPWTGSG